MGQPEIARVADLADAFVVGPDDILVIRIADDVAQDSLDGLMGIIRERLGNRALLVGGDGVQLGVVRGGGDNGVPVDA